MSKLGVVANGRSWRNRDAEGGSPPPADVLFEAPDSPDEYPAILKRFAEAGVAVVAVDGGDGTLRDVMSAMIPAYGDELPAIALMPSGKTNIAAIDVGGVGRGDEALGRLADAVRVGAATRDLAVRRPIEIAFGDKRLFGFVFGLGAFEKATRLVDERVHGAGFAQKLGVVLGVGVSLGQAFFGREREAWRRGTPLTITVDGGEPKTHDSFVLLATTLRRWMPGLWPFWGNGDGAIALTEIEAPPRRLALGLVTAGLGRPRPWAEAEGYRSVKADAVRLTAADAFIVDGDRFEPAADGRIELRAGPPISFVRL